MGQNLYQRLHSAWERRLDDPALVVPSGPTWTYADLDTHSDRMAVALAATGARPGDRVVVQVDKSADAVALYLACLRAGFVYVPLNTAYTPTEVDFFVSDAEASAFVGRSDRPVPDAATVGLTLDDDGSGSLLDAAAVAEPTGAISARGGDDWITMLYTSGTTGRSKGAMLSATNLLSNADALRTAWHWQPDDVLCHILPIFHVHGLFVALHCAFLDGGTIHLLPHFDVDTIRTTLPASSVLMGVPTHYGRLLADPAFGADDCASMRLFTSGSAPMTAAMHEAFTERTGHEIVERYGMTEAMIMTSNPYDGARVPGTVGMAVPGVEIRVADADGVECEPDATGIVETRGPNVFAGYWGLPDKTAETVRPDGWLITGDVGTMDGDGRVTLAGRQSDLIISGGLNIYPKEIEQVLDAVDGVVESAVVGVPDDDFGEQVVGIVVVDGAADEVLARCRAACTALARFKHPRLYEVVDQLPRNAMGKVQKAALRQRIASER